MNPASKHTAEHYTWGSHCDGWKLVASEGLSVIQERMPPGTSEVKHFHERSRQFFFVLSGRLTILLENGSQELGPEQGLEIPPRMIHKVLNNSDSDVSFLVVSAPPSHGDRVLAE